MDDGGLCPDLQDDGGPCPDLQDDGGPCPDLQDDDLIYRWIFWAYFMFVEAKVKNTYSHDVVS